jgi:hypothetical protein
MIVFTHHLILSLLISVVLAIVEVVVEGGDTFASAFAWPSSHSEQICCCTNQTVEWK